MSVVAWARSLPCRCGDASRITPEPGGCSGLAERRLCPWRRYGWEYGLPAFAATQFVSYSRVQAHQHRWYDTLASSGIAAGYAYVLGTPFKKRYKVETSLTPAPDGAMLQLSYRW